MIAHQFLIVANWKANNPPWTSLPPFAHVEVAIAAPFPAISQLSGGPFTLAAQDISLFPPGPYTGEVPAALLAALGVKYVLVGHSERRKYLHETNLEVEAKLKQAIDNAITPVVCAQTIDEIPENIRNYHPDQYLIMFEPAYAISTAGQYHPESPERIEATLADWKAKLNLKCRFLYGGSVHPDSIGQLLAANSQLVSGLVVGHASLDPNEFYAIITSCQKALASF